MSNCQGEKRGISLNDLFPVIEEKLQNGGTVSFGPHGISMRPLIRQGKDSVSVSPLVGKPKKNDVVFYRRPDGQFVLHRIVGEGRHGYILCGDNQSVREYSVKADWIVGVLSAVSRKGRTVDCQGVEYRFYVKVLLPLWRVWVKIRGVLGKIKRKLK